MSTDIRTASLVDELVGLVAADEDAVALARAMDPQTQDLATHAEECAFFSRIADLDETQCDEVARWFRLVELEGWDVAGLDRKRTILAQMVEVYRRRGTRWAWDRITEILETPVLWDDGHAEWDMGGAVWDERDGMWSLTEWFDTPPDPPYTYRVDALIEHRGLTLAEIRHILQVLDAYVPLRAHLLELSETMEVDSDLVCAGYPEIGLHIEVY